ncbi:universal stress protein [Chitinophaga qingshengii]|uniref:Universal stress protein n=1 Tax=Chitinophaga qingshengii TaxID=1569794 RepID=A0ABR7TNI6_9BACT|nr:universal stress protein [Chitinophaga qingshengii]MBC9932046.1 universal stress protein [Chitinophaga qingshengii]
MISIAAILDGLRYSENVQRYALMVAKQQGAHVNGVLPEDFTYNSFGMYQVLKSGADADTINKLENADKATRKASAAIFEAACQKANVPYSIHHHRNVSLLDVLETSIYSDLLIVDRKETFAHDTMNPPTRFIRDLLTDVQCPVLLTPSGKAASTPEWANVVLLYDGEPSSVYAIKMYSYLLAAVLPVSVTVLSVNEAGNHLQNRHLVHDFILGHFPKATYRVVEGDPETEIIGYLQNQPNNTLVVLGAYRRGAVSRWFRESMADVLMSKLNLPLFIAHNK